MAAVEVIQDEDQLMSLKVMRLSRPTLEFKPSIYTDGQVIIGDEPILTGISSLNLEPVNNLALSPILEVPTPSDSIYLGETFSCYICVNNESDHILQSMTLKVELQATYRQFSLVDTTLTPQDIHPNRAAQFIIHHEVKELGMHFLLCSVHYLTTSNERKFFKKIYKVNVLNPLAVKTKANNLRGQGVVLLEVQIQNLTDETMYLEVMKFEPAEPFKHEDLNFIYNQFPSRSKSTFLHTSPKLIKCSDGIENSYNDNEGIEANSISTKAEELSEGTKDSNLGNGFEESKSDGNFISENLKNTESSEKQQSEDIDIHFKEEILSEKEEEFGQPLLNESIEDKVNSQHEDNPLEHSNEMIKDLGIMNESNQNANKSQGSLTQNDTVTDTKCQTSPSFDLQTIEQTPLDSLSNNSSIFGQHDYLKPKDTRQYLYKLKPLDPLSNLSYTSKELGKLDIVWRTSFCGVGRLQTSQLTRRPPILDSIDIKPTHIPDLILMNNPFTIEFSVQHRTGKPIDAEIIVDRTRVGSILYVGKSPIRLGEVQQGQSRPFKLQFMPLSPGPHKLGGLKILDKNTNNTIEFDVLAEVLVYHRAMN